MEHIGTSYKESRDDIILPLVELGIITLNLGSMYLGCKELKIGHTP